MEDTSLQTNQVESKQETGKRNNSEQVFQEDRVVQDISLVKEFLSNIVSKINGRIQTRHINRETQLKPVRSVKIFDNSIHILGGFVKILALVGFVLVVIYTFFRLFEIFRESRQENEVLTTLTPSPVEYKSEYPSAYAEDLVILQLEEEIRVLEKQISGVDVREIELMPPILDFNIDF